MMDTFSRAQNAWNKLSKNFEPKENDTYVRLKEEMLGRNNILSRKNLSPLEQLFYVRCVISSQLNQSKPIEKSSEYLGYELGTVDLDTKNLRSKILRIEKNLEKKGLLQVMRLKNKEGHYCKNLITPLIPDDLNSNNQFIPIKYDMVKELFSNRDLSANFKLFLLRIYAIAFKNFQVTGELSFCTTTSELMKSSGMSRPSLFSFFKIITEQISFVTREQKYIYFDAENDNRCDWSVHKFILDERLVPNCFKNTNQISNEDELLLVDQYQEEKPVSSQVKPSRLTSEALDSRDINKPEKIETSKTISKDEKDKKENSTLFPSHTIDTTNVNSVVNEKKSLKHYYPLTKEEVSDLNWKSNREFSTNYGNQLLLKLSGKYPTKTFLTRSNMMSYMTEAFIHEKDKAPLVNHESFRFNCNIENAKSVHDIKDREKDSHSIRELESLENPHDTASTLDKSNIEVQTISDKYTSSLSSIDENSGWYKIRKGLIEELGVDTDKAWFSKAKALENKDNQTLELTMPTKFMAHWINTRYGNVITRLASSVGFKFIELTSSEDS